jgi:hypothetical protein
MSEYIPMSGSLPGEQFMPSNSCDGEAFWAAQCNLCERDKVMNGTVDQDDAGDDDFCPILGASFCGEAVEWREMPDGECKCVAFVPMGEKVLERDDFTIDMFGGGA